MAASDASRTLTFEGRYEFAAQTDDEPRAAKTSSPIGRCAAKHELHVGPDQANVRSCRLMPATPALLFTYKCFWPRTMFLVYDSPFLHPYR